ncbi:MAG TPA: IclR family transcriptional regulator [Usitatibacter sp.]|jgi:DNA-binding IclR family transcriptional regulator|nr:IclR family transcriptional regulator [Usitatibacter sp.]
MGKTIGKAFSVLEALATAAAPQRVSDLAEKTGLSEPSTCRLLGSLVELGYAAREESTSRYSATLKLWEVSQRLIGRSDDLQVIAQPMLAELSTATHESCALGVFDDGFSVYIAKADGSRAIRAVATVGARLPATATGFGKAILAWRPELLPQALLRVRRFTPRTLVNRRDIERDLDESRARGYAISRGELHEDTCSIGAPVFDAAGVVVAGLALWGARDSILGRNETQFARETLEAAKRISARLGFVRQGVPAPRRRAQARVLASRRASGRKSPP